MYSKIEFKKILEKAKEGVEISSQEAIVLLSSREPENLELLKNTANFLRSQQAGESISYVINRNINFTNICEQHCNFCAFRRDAQDQGAFFLESDQILEKAQSALAIGATEICMQGGLNPNAKLEGKSLNYYLNLVSILKDKYPQLHLHAFSPQEIEFIAREDGITYKDVLVELKAAGLDSLPGTAAEILTERARKIICPEKINTQIWLEIITLAHSLGLPTTSTMLSGHIETIQEQVEHLEKLRCLQKKAIAENHPARITEFILLPFVGQNAPSMLRKRVDRDQPILEDCLILTAVARIYLGNVISNHQPSWVKLGLSGAIQALEWGCNDLGGTLMEEHITSMAGAIGGGSLEVEQLQKAISSIGRPYQQRTTLYKYLSQHELECSGSLKL